MRERPIIFSDEMVRAILAGRKTQTRRIVRPQPPSVEAVRKRAGEGFHLFTDWHTPNVFRVAGPVWAVREEMGRMPRWRCPYGAHGDRLWVRETWYCDHFAAGDYECMRRMRPGITDAQCIGGWSEERMMDYRATHGCRDWEAGCPCRDEEGRSAWRPSIHMPRWASRITLEVTNVRVERLQEITPDDCAAEGIGFDQIGPTTCWIDAFVELWDALNNKRAPWSSNPWVFVVSFRRIEP